MTASNGHSITTIANYWNKRGPSYGRSWQSLAKRKLSRLETGLIRQLIGKHKTKVLDIGIGLGRVSDELIKSNVELFGIDISKAMIDYSWKKYRQNKKVKQLKIHNILNPLPKDWGQFDLITAYRILSYYKDLSTPLKNIYSSLKKNGWLIFTYPNIYSSVIFPKIRYRNHWLGNETSYNKLRSIVADIGFSECQIFGYSRLLDLFYDRSNNDLSTNLLFGLEKMLTIIFGTTRFVRLFYVICKK